MAVKNTTDPGAARRALTRWLATKLHAVDGPQISELSVPSSSGLSNETLLFSVAWTHNGVSHDERLVARVQPTGPAVHPDYDLAAEAALLRTLSSTATVPVPRVRWHESDPKVLGAPFIVMDHVQGRVPSDDPPYTTAGWVLDLSAQQRATLSGNAIAILANIHQIDWRANNLGFLNRPQYGAIGLDQQLGYIEHAYRWTAGNDTNPTVEAAFEWVKRNRPTDPQPLVLNWGDARIGNMLFADDLTVAAVLDWEMATIASPEMDLGWWLFLQRHHTEGIGAPLPPGILSRDQTISRYADLSGFTADNIDYYEIFATLRGAIQMQRTGALLIDAGFLPADSPIKTANPANLLLAELLDLPASPGIAESWIGNR